MPSKKWAESPTVPDIIHTKNSHESLAVGTCMVQTDDDNSVRQFRRVSSIHNGINEVEGDFIVWQNNGINRSSLMKYLYNAQLDFSVSSRLVQSVRQSNSMERSKRVINYTVMQIRAEIKLFPTPFMRIFWNWT